MDHKRRVRKAALAAMVLIGGMQVGCAQTGQSAGPTAQQTTEERTQDRTADAAATASAASATSVAEPAGAPAASAVQVASPTPAQASVLTQEEAQQNAAGNVAELQRMIRGSQLSELRTVYNGSYGASLMFYPQEMTYYVALFQNKTFWRVIKTTDETRAELIYRDFAQKTQQLSDVEIRKIRLAAQKAFTERMIALTQDRASRLQADLDIARQQQVLVANQQKLTRAQASVLQAQKSAAQDQLRAVQRHVRELQRQVEGGLQ